MKHTLDIIFGFLFLISVVVPVWLFNDLPGDIGDMGAKLFFRKIPKKYIRRINAVFLLTGIASIVALYIINN